MALGALVDELSLGLAGRSGQIRCRAVQVTARPILIDSGASGHANPHQFLAPQSHRVLGPAQCTHNASLLRCSPPPTSRSSQLPLAANVGLRSAHIPRMIQKRRKVTAVAGQFLPARFEVDPVCCEFQADENDIVYSGSEDERYDSSKQRRLACENQATRFIQGKPALLLSTVLRRGPFDVVSGWTNPWRSRTSSKTPGRTKKRGATGIEREKRPKKRKRRQHTTSDLEVETRGKPVDCSIVIKDSFYLPSPDTTVSPTYFEHEYLDDDALSRVKRWATSIASLDKFDTATNSSPGRTVRDCADEEEDAETDGVDDISNVVNVNPTPKAPRLSSERIRGDVQETCVVSSASTADHCQTKMMQPSQCSSESKRLKSPTKSRLFPLDIADFSPRAVKIYDEEVERHSRRGTRPQPGPILHDRTPVSQPTPASLVRASLRLTEESGDAGFQTCSDRSFRFHSKATRVKRKSIYGDAPVDIVSKLSDAKHQVEEQEDNKHNRKRKSLGTPPARSSKTTQRAEEEMVNATLTVECAHLLAASNSAAVADGRSACDPDHSTFPDQQPLRESDQDVSVFNEPSEQGTASEAGDDTATNASQIDFLSKFGTLKSPESNPIDLGAFSFENESQAFLADLTTGPRKLLWPRSQQPTVMAACVPLPEPRATNASEHHSEAVGTASEAGESSESYLLGEEEAPDTPSAPAESGDASEPTETNDKAQQGELKIHEQLQSPAAAPVMEAAPVLEAVSHLDNQASDTAEVKGKSEAQGNEYEDKADNDLRTTNRNGLSGVVSETLTKPTSQRCDQDQQSPWAKETAPPLVPTEQPKMALTQARDSTQPPHEDHGDESKPQNLWTIAAETTLPPLVTFNGTSQPPAESASLTLVAHQALNFMSQQSPQARENSQSFAFVNLRDLKIQSSPPVGSCQPEATLVDFTYQESFADQDIEIPSALFPPATPERRNLTLPTPEVSLSIKSFREFITPSPSKRTPLGPTNSNGRLPSTQVLNNAVVSNPWTKTSRRRRDQRSPRSSLTSCLSQRRIAKRPKEAKRVSWALRDDITSSPKAQAEPGILVSSPVTITITTSLPKIKSTQRSRASSPPPSSLVGPEELPKENQKFGKHFATVMANRARRGAPQRRVSGICETPMLRVGRGVQLLPSESQQVCPSPAADAMAEAFIRADGDVQQAEETKRHGDNMIQQTAGGAAWSEFMDAEMAAAEEAEMAANTQAPIQTEEYLDDNADYAESQGSVDDVSAVLENLDSFLNTWDVDKELAKARAEREAEERENGFHSMSGAAGFMDVGVRD